MNIAYIPLGCLVNAVKSGIVTVSIRARF